MDAAGTRIEDGAVAVTGDRILAVGPAADFTGWSVVRRIDADGGIVMPGLINAHTHAAMTCFRGLADDLPLMNWLDDHIFPAEAAARRRNGLQRHAAGLRRNDPFGHHLFLRHVPLRRRGGARRERGRRAGGGRRSAVRFPLPQLRSARKRVRLRRAHDRHLATRSADHHRRRAPLPLPVRRRTCSQRAATLASENGLPLVIHLSETRSEVRPDSGHIRPDAGRLAGRPGRSRPQPARLPLRGPERGRHRPSEGPRRQGRPTTPKAT